MSFPYMARGYEPEYGFNVTLPYDVVQYKRLFIYITPVHAQVHKFSAKQVADLVCRCICSVAVAHDDRIKIKMLYQRQILLPHIAADGKRPSPRHMEDGQGIIRVHRPGQYTRRQEQRHEKT